MVQNRIAAFFDFDNTLITGDSQGLEIDYLFKNRLVPFSNLIPIIIANFFFKRNLLSSENMVRVCLRIYRGRRADQPATWADDLYLATIRSRLSPRMMATVTKHRRKGHLPVILSASLPHLIKPAADGLEIEHVICTQLEANSAGVLTGRTKGPVCVGRQKATQAIRLAEKLGMNLKASYAYSDHHADIELFKVVGHPVAVSPTPKLLRYANRHNWKIMSNCWISKPPLS